MLENGVRDKTEGGTVRFLGSMANPQTESKDSGLPVAVSLSALGLTGSVRVDDLWTHRVVGDFTGEFAPTIAWYGAGLYRLSQSTVPK